MRLKERKNRRRHEQRGVEKKDGKKDRRKKQKKKRGKASATSGNSRKLLKDMRMIQANDSVEREHSLQSPRH